MEVLRVERLDSLRDEVRGMMGNDPAHDFGHVMRVCKNAQMLCRREGGDESLVVAAALLHDIVSYPKSDARSKGSSAESAAKARLVLERHGFGAKEICVIHDAIRDHSYSRNRTPATLEGKILQDADRLDALGAVGIARVFATGGILKRPLYDPEDPFCAKRSPDDRTWTVDHFFQKLLKLESLMNTGSARAEAARRTAIMRGFLGSLREEI